MINSKLPLIMTISYIAILFVSIVTFSILQTSTKPDLPNPSTITVYSYSTKQKDSYEKGSEEYNEIMRLYNAMFEKTYLNQLSDREVLSGKILENTAAAPWTEYNKETGTYLKFTYDTPKKFIVYSGKNSKRVDIQTLYIQIDNTDSVKQIALYYDTKIDTTGNPGASSTDAEENAPEVGYTPLIAEANTHDLYQYVISQFE